MEMASDCVNFHAGNMNVSDCIGHEFCPALHTAWQYRQATKANSAIFFDIFAVQNGVEYGAAY